MVSDLMWKRDARGVEHPTQEILLAFISEQCSEHEKNCISEHLLAGCAPCNRLQKGLSQDCGALNHLNHMSRYLYYPELQSEQVLLHAQRSEPLTSAWTGKRKRKFQVSSRSGARPQATGLYGRKASMRFISIPVAFGIFLFLTVIVIALTYALVTMKPPFLLPGQQNNNIYQNRGSNTPGVAQHQLTPTVTAPVKLSPTPLVSATGTVLPRAMIETCQQNKDTRSIVHICGSGFKVDDKISLKVDYFGSNSLKTRGPITIDKDGRFSYKLYVSSCWSMPIAIYAVDETQLSAIITSNTLTNLPATGCNSPTPTLWPSPTTTSGSHQ